MENNELIKKLSKTLSRDKQDVTKLVNGLIDIFADYSKSFDSIAIPQFGTFQIEKVNETVVDDETSGKRFLMPPSLKYNFVAGAILKNKVKGTANEY